MEVIIAKQNKIHELAVAFNDWFNQLEELNDELESPGKPSTEVLYRKIARAMQKNDTKTYYKLSAEMNKLWMSKINTRKEEKSKIFL